MKLLRGIPEYVRVHRGSFWQNKLLWHEKTNKQTVPRSGCCCSEGDKAVTKLLFSGCAVKLRHIHNLKQMLRYKKKCHVTLQLPLICILRRSHNSINYGVKINHIAVTQNK